jgi:hypothetical protein
MPDITMCTGTCCTKANRCYRYTAIPNNEYQSYMSSPYIYWSDRDKIVCGMYWPLVPSTKEST